MNSLHLSIEDENDHEMLDSEVKQMLPVDVIPCPVCKVFFYDFQV